MSEERVRERRERTKRRRRKHHRLPATERRSQARIETARNSFAAAVDQLRSEERFRGWLEAQRQLHRYSPRNVLWILFQRPDATYVASYNDWKEKLGYQVRRGEEGIMVWVPARRRRRSGVDVDGEEEKEDLDASPPFFLVGKVFDRSQVDPIPGEAKSLAPPPPAAITGDSHAWALPGLEVYAASLGYEVQRLGLPEGDDGFCDYARRLIGVEETLAANGQVYVLAHEGGHATGVDSKTFGRARAETIVDCAAYIVCARIGLDVAAASVPYVAAWAGEDTEVIARDAAEIDRLARAILRGVGLRGEATGARASDD